MFGETRVKILMDTQERPSRREFLAAMAQTGIFMPLAARSAASTCLHNSAQVSNDFFSVAFNAESGQFHIWRSDGLPFLVGARVKANTQQGSRDTGESAYSHLIDTKRFHDILGEGIQLLVYSKDAEFQLNFELRITLYNGHPFVLVDAECTNVSSESITMRSLEPICAIPEKNGGLFWSVAAKILTNGQMYSDPGKVVDFAPSETLRSWWNICFFSGYEREGLVCGSLENQTAFGQMAVRKEKGDVTSLIAESFFAERFKLEPGQKIRSNRFMMNIGAHPYAALESYAEIMGVLGSARVFSVLNGWCSWFYTYEHVTEEEVIRNAEFIARVMKPFGLNTIQVDEGYQRRHGDWEGNDRFPHGMQWLAERILALGLKPGIWIAPYIISESTAVFQNHADWLLRHPDGRLKRVGPWPSEESDWAKNENPKRYCLDITHPQAAEWLGNLFKTVARVWGYQMIKIDFVGWSLLSAESYYDPTITQAAAYRMGFEIMRQNVGPDCHLQDCGPGPVTVGLADSMRIELDQNYGFRKNAWQQYFLTSTGSAAAAAKRYYFHKRTWINDADHVCLNLLSHTQAQAAATLIGLTGGNILSGDRLTDLDATRLAILQKITPSFGQAARPVDLYDTDQQKIFAITIDGRMGAYTVAAFFNPDASIRQEYCLPLQRLWLDAGKSYIAYDFWQERLHGIIEKQLRVTVLPQHVTLLSLHEKREVPQVISTDRHVLQGALELAEVRWDRESETLSGLSFGPLGSAHNVVIYIPQPIPWVQGGPSLFRDIDGYSLKMLDEQLLRLHVRFTKEEHVSWKIRMRDLFGS